MRALSWCLVAVVSLAAGGCRQRVAEPTRVHVFVGDGHGEPMAGVELRLDGEPVGVSAPDGTAWLSWGADRRGRLELAVRCPEGTRGPRPRRLRARHPGVRRLELRCESQSHVAYLAIAADGAAGLPVRVDGVQLATLPESGVLHTQVSRPAGSAVRVQIDTSQHPELRPQNPVVEVRLDRDEVVVMHPEFERVRPRRVRPRAARHEAPPRRLRSL